MNLCERSNPPCRNKATWYIAVRSKVDSRFKARNLCTFHARRAEVGEWFVEYTRKLVNE